MCISIHMTTNKKVSDFNFKFNENKQSNLPLTFSNVNSYQ